MFVLEGGVDLACNLVASQKLPHEIFYVLYIEGPLVVGVNSIKNVFGEILELIQVNKDIS